MFLGTHTPKLDDKGRLALPAKFRDALAGGLMVTKGQDHCLFVFPRAEFEQMARKVAEAPFTNEAVRAYQRYLFAGTDEQARALAERWTKALNAGYATLNPRQRGARPSPARKR